MPRREGMERKDLLAANVKIFKSQGKSLAEGAKSTTKVSIFYLSSSYAETSKFLGACCRKSCKYERIHYGKVCGTENSGTQYYRNDATRS
jgi:hypothetical protein